MRHILVALIVGAALAVSTSAALAYGDRVDYPGVGLQQDRTAPGAGLQEIKNQPSPSLFVATGSAATNLWLGEMRDQNIGH